MHWVNRKEKTMAKTSGRKKEKILRATYQLNPKVDFQSEDAQKINQYMTQLDSLPDLYGDNDLIPPSSRKTPEDSKRTALSLSVIQSSDNQFKRRNELLFSDPRLANTPSKAAYSDTAKSIAELMYYPGIDRLAVSKIGALLLLRSKISDASIAAGLLNKPAPLPGSNKVINQEIERLTDQLNLLSQPSVIRTINQIKTSMDIRATQIKNNAKAYQTAKTNQQRLKAIRDLAEEGIAV